MRGWLVEHEPAVRVTAFAAVLGLLVLLESLRPRRPVQRRARRLGLHALLSAVDTAAIRLIAPLGLAGVALWLDARGGGLLTRAGMPALLRGVVGFVALDLAVYLQHRAFHAVPALWRLHLVHHSDEAIDASTGIRFHPVEIALSLVFKGAVVAITGAPAAAVIAFEVVLNAGSMFTHANWFIAPAVDRRLRRLVVTPDMHRVHHSTSRAEQSTNFGFNFSWWDRLFRTYVDQPQAGHAGMTIGVTGVAPPATLPALLGLPWRANDSAPVRKNPQAGTGPGASVY